MKYVEPVYNNLCIIIRPKKCVWFIILSFLKRNKIYLAMSFEMSLRVKINKMRLVEKIKEKRELLPKFRQEESQKPWEKIKIVSCFQNVFKDLASSKARQCQKARFYEPGIKPLNSTTAGEIPDRLSERKFPKEFTNSHLVFLCRTGLRYKSIKHWTTYCSDT